MIDDRSDDEEWLKLHDYVMLERNNDVREARYAPGVTDDLWSFLDDKRQRAIAGRVSAVSLNDAYAINATIRRLKKIAERTGKVIGRRDT